MIAQSGNAHQQGREIVEVLQGIVKKRERGSELQLRHSPAALTGL
jgi:hypothetical protein